MERCSCVLCFSSVLLDVCREALLMNDGKLLFVLLHQPSTQVTKCKEASHKSQCYWILVLHTFRSLGL